MIRNGVIARATWEVTEAGRKPYIKLEIETEPFDFHGTTLNRVFKVVNPVIPLWIGQLSPLQALEKVTEVELQIDFTKPIKIGREIPELSGRPISFELVEETFGNTTRPRVRRLFKRR